jgi:hypothetical protein
MTLQELREIAKPMPFSTNMVQAILGDRKTMTRRVVKPKIIVDNGINSCIKEIVQLCPNKPRYQKGDILYVRETFKQPDYYNRDSYSYKADDKIESFPDNLISWSPSIHMPKEAARIFLRVTGVRLERLQEITPDDRLKEGIESDCRKYQKTAITHLGYFCDCVKQFKSLWDSIYAKPQPVKKKIDGKTVITHYESYPWENIQETREYKGKPWFVYGNPWVWVYEFERVKVD